MTTFESAGIAFDLRRSVAKIVLKGSPVSVSLKVPNSPSACLPKLLRSTRKRTRLAGVYESILYAAKHAVNVLPAPVAREIKALRCPSLKLLSKLFTALNWQSLNPLSDNVG